MHSLQKGLESWVALEYTSVNVHSFVETTDLISRNLKSGDSVQIAYNVGGLIVGIQPAMNHQQCT